MAANVNGVGAPRGFLSELPKLRLTPEPSNTTFIVDPALLQSLMAGAQAADVDLINEDLGHLETELMGFFRENCYQADVYQNRYRLVQFGYIILAFVATVIGSLLAFVANEPTRPGWLIPVLSFSETIVALIAVFLSSIASPSALLDDWLTHRRRAEGLRQEWFRFLMHGSPYDVIEDAAERQLRLSNRAAQINAGQQAK